MAGRESDLSLSLIAIIARVGLSLIRFFVDLASLHRNLLVSLFRLKCLRAWFGGRIVENSVFGWLLRAAVGV